MIDSKNPFSQLVQKYAFSKSSGTPLAVVVLLGMVVIFVISVNGRYGDLEAIVMSFGFSAVSAAVVYFLLYSVAYEPLLLCIAVTGYSAAWLLEVNEQFEDILNIVGGIAVLAIFAKWARKIRRAETVHKSDFD